MVETARPRAAEFRNSKASFSKYGFCSFQARFPQASHRIATKDNRAREDINCVISATNGNMHATLCLTIIPPSIHALDSAPYMVFSFEPLSSRGLCHMAPSAQLVRCESRVSSKRPFRARISLKEPSSRLCFGISQPALSTLTF